MFRKYSLLVGILSVLAFGPKVAVAQTTMDVPILIQNIMDEFSRLRGMLKQLESTLNIEQMAKNLGNPEALKAMAGKALKASSESKEGNKKLAPYLPTELAASIDDVDKSSQWIRDKLRPKKDATVEERQKIRGESIKVIFAAQAGSYGKAIALRRRLDKLFEDLEPLQEDAKATESDMELMNEINRISMLKLEQDKITQMIKMSQSQAVNTSSAATDQSE